MPKIKPTKRSYLVIGQITGAHGIRGEVKVSVMTDFPERYKPGARLFIGSETEGVPIEVQSVRPHKEALLVKLNTVPDRTTAETLRGQYLLIPEEEAMPLGEHEYYAHDLIGLSVVSTDGKALGTLTEILYTGANDVYVAKGEGGEVLLPALREVIVQVDLPGRTMLVAVPDGLLDAEKD